MTPTITPAEATPTTRPFLRVSLVIGCSSFMTALEAFAKIRPDHLFEFGQSVLPFDERTMVSKLKLPQGPVGLDEIQKASPASAIADSRGFNALSCLRQHGGPIQHRHFPTGTDFCQQIPNLKTGQIFRCVEVGARRGNRRRSLMHGCVVLRLGPERERHVDGYHCPEPVAGLEVLEPLETHVEIRQVLAESKSAGAFIPLDGQLASFQLRSGSNCDLKQFFEVLVEPLVVRRLWGLQRKPWIPIQKRVQLGPRGVAVLLQRREMLVKGGQFNLGFEHINLTAFPCPEL